MSKGERRAARRDTSLSRVSRSRAPALVRYVYALAKEGRLLTRRDLSTSCVSLRVFPSAVPSRSSFSRRNGQADRQAGRQAGGWAGRQTGRRTLSRPEGEAKFASVSERSSETDERETETGQERVKKEKDRQTEREKVLSKKGYIDRVGPGPSAGTPPHDFRGGSVLSLSLSLPLFILPSLLHLLPLSIFLSLLV